MPTVPEGVEQFVKAGILYGPGKAANAGGVATSGLEQSQNSLRLSWTREEVDSRLHGIMKSIHKQCVDAAEAYGTPRNYVNGANIAGFVCAQRRHGPPHRLRLRPLPRTGPARPGRLVRRRPPREPLCAASANGHRCPSPIAFLDSPTGECSLSTTWHGAETPVSPGDGRSR